MARRQNVCCALFHKKRRRRPLKWIPNVLSGANNPKGEATNQVQTTTFIDKNASAFFQRIRNSIPSGESLYIIDKNASAFFQRIRDSIPSGESLYIYSLRDMYNVSANGKTHYFVERTNI
jgi:hypothetical protein